MIHSHAMSTTSSRVRHLNQFDLTDDPLEVSSPFHRIDVIPTSVHEIAISSLPNKINRGFQKRGKLHNYS
jgi:hypothetical protein